MGMTELAEYERAIVLSFELVQPNSLEQISMQKEATAYCERIETAAGGWMAPIRLLGTTVRPEVKFYCLQALQKLLSDDGKYLQLAPEEKMTLRTSILTWLSSVCPLLHQEAKFIRSKLGVVIALLIKREYTTIWKSAFDDLLQLLRAGPGGADVLVFTLAALDEEVVSMGGNEAMIIKDEMRISSVAKIMPALAEIAVAYSHSDIDLVRRCWTVVGQYVDWVDIGLATQDRFLQVWFTHCLDERFRASAVAALSRLLQKGMDSGNKFRLIQHLGLADACVEICLRSAVNVGRGTVMNPDPSPAPSVWTMFMEEYKRSNAIHHPTTQQDDEQYAHEAARFCQYLGLQMLECRKSFVAQGDIHSLDQLRPLVDKSLFCLFSFMSRVNKLDEQSAVLEFAVRMVTSNKEIMNDNVKKEVVEHANYFGTEVAHRMLYAVLACVRLPVEINLKAMYSSMGADSSFMNGGGGSADSGELANGMDDEESEFREHRSNVKRLYLNLVKNATPKIVLPFLRSVAEQCLLTLTPKQPPHDAEAVLYLIHAFGEGAPEVGTQRQAAPEVIADFDQVLLTVFRAQVFQGQCHPLLAIMYNELAARYVISLRVQPIDLIALVVERVTGKVGLHHPSSRVRSKAAGLLLRIVRSLENACAQLAENILRSLTDVLGLPYELCVKHLYVIRKKGASKFVVSPGMDGKKDRPILGVPEVVLVYETIGLLLGQTIYWADQNTRRLYLGQVLNPVEANLKRACIAARESGAKSDEVVHWGACQLEALASLAKGFNNQSDTPDILELWKEVLRTALIATVELEPVSSDTEFLLNNLRRLCHILIRTIGTEILAFFGDICRALLESPNADICRSLPLLNQMMTAFKSKMHPTLLDSLLPILRSTNKRIAVVANREQPTIHDREELIAMEKELFTFLLAIASSDLSGVFYEMPNRSHLEELLTMITDGMASIPDAAVQRICASILQTLCNDWLGASSRFPEDLRPALVQFAFERITPASFRATFQSHFYHGDAACSQLLVTICTLHRTLFARCGQEWIKYLGGVFLQSVAPPIAEEYCKAVSVTENPKELRNIYKKLFLEDGNR